MGKGFAGVPWQVEGRARLRLPVVVGAGVVAAAVLAAAVWVALPAGGQGFEVLVGEGAQQAEALASDEAQDAPAETVFVHVSGAVAAPGLYEVTEGARVADAVSAAGGFAEGAAADALNLARVLSDGEQIDVPSQEEAAQAQEGGAVAAGSVVAASATGKVNINTASAEQLDALPGIGPSTAGKIVADREANGPFATIEDLKRVSGIGDKKYAALSDVICVG